MARVVGGYSNPLEPSPLASEAEGRKLKIDVYLEEELKEELEGVVMLSPRKVLLLCSKRSPMEIGLSTNSRFGLTMPPWSHKGTNSVL